MNLGPQKKPSEMLSTTVESMFKEGLEKAQTSDGKAAVMAVRTLATLQLRMHTELIQAIRDTLSDSSNPHA